MVGSATIGDDPSTGQLHTRQPNEHAAQGRPPTAWGSAELEAGELVLGQQVQATDGQYAPAGLVELVDLVDLERAGGVQRVADRLPRPERCGRPRFRPPGRSSPAARAARRRWCTRSGPPTWPRAAQGIRRGSDRPVARWPRWTSRTHRTMLMTGLLLPRPGVRAGPASACA
jgi:hypothetical protein